MAVDVDLDVFAVGLLDAADDVVGGLGLQQCSHVFECQRFRAHIQQLTGELHVALHGVQRRDGVADGALGVLAGLLHRRHGLSHIARIVERIEDPEDVHAVLGGLLDEALDHAVLVVAVAQQVLATQQHLQLGVGQQLAEGAQPLPGILVEESDTGVVGRSAPAFNAPVPGGIDVGTGINHVLDGHSRGHQALVRVTQGELCHPNCSLTHGAILTRLVLTCCRHHQLGSS